MIDVTSFDDRGALEVTLSGRVTEDDYTKVLMPAIDAATAAYDRVRVLVMVSPELEGFSAGAAFEDARTGLRHWRGFDRIALVADQGWITRSVKIAAPFFPCPVNVFPVGAEDEARRWLEESLGSIHQKDLGNGVLHVSLMGQIDADSYARESGDLNAFLRDNDDVLLLLDLREFSGWRGLDAIGDHLKLVRDHHRRIKRAAIVGDSGWAKMAEGVGGRLLKAETRYFYADDLDAAERWLRKD